MLHLKSLTNLRVLLPHFHGESDPWLSANDTVRYFGAMAATNENVSPVDDYARLYLVPGMVHCSGGDQTIDTFDLLTPLVEWVETGNAPGSIVATGQSMPGDSRPLCPFPEYAHYRNGDPAQSDSFICRLP
jgi:feruloyl esterase